MESFNRPFSAAKSENDDSKEREYSSPTGNLFLIKNSTANNLLKKFQRFGTTKVKPSLSPYRYIPKLLFFYGSHTYFYSYQLHQPWNQPE
jgi:hypothetical protein